jgi:hypothetical protein
MAVQCVQQALYLDDVMHVHSVHIPLNKKRHVRD